MGGVGGYFGGHKLHQFSHVLVRFFLHTNREWVRGTSEDAGERGQGTAGCKRGRGSGRWELE